jgi:creatinine amidohydrolase/Fe(II)-dependent formamide hydrolase-like protein
MVPVVELVLSQDVQLDRIGRARDAEQQVGDKELRVGVERLFDDHEGVDVTAGGVEAAERERAVKVDPSQVVAEEVSETLDQAVDLLVYAARRFSSQRFSPA